MITSQKRRLERIVTLAERLQRSTSLTVAVHTTRHVDAILNFD